MNQLQVTVPDAAKEAGVLTGYVRELLASGRLKGQKVDGQWLIDRKAFELWRSNLEQRRRMRGATA